MKTTAELLDETRLVGISFQQAIASCEERLDRIKQGDVRSRAARELTDCRRVFATLSRSMQMINDLNAAIPQNLKNRVIGMFGLKSKESEVISKAVILLAINNARNCIERIEKINESLDTYEVKNARQQKEVA